MALRLVRGRSSRDFMTREIFTDFCREIIRPS
jgi:hypothetical protein